MCIFVCVLGNLHDLGRYLRKIDVGFDNLFRIEQNKLCFDPLGGTTNEFSW